MLVSIYMPTKNRVELLKRAVESVQAQTYTQWELWVVDDGSSDATPAYLSAASAADSRIRCIRHEQSRGAPHSRNLAIRQARGELITGLDDDDYFHEQRLEKLIAAWRALERNGTSFSCLYTQDVESMGARQRVSRKPPQVDVEDLFFYNLIGNQIFTRREYLLGAGLFDEQMPAWQDLDLFLRVVDRYGTALLVDEPLYFLELAPRGDRISMSAARVEAAYRRLAAKVESRAPVMRQGLFLQRFGELYGYRFRGNDWREFLRFGLHLRTLKRLAGILVRQLRDARKATHDSSQPPASAHERSASALRVLMFPKYDGNPYLQMLASSLERRHVRIDDFNFQRAFGERYDVVHVHWPDLHLHASSLGRALAKHARLALLFAVLRWRKTRIVWTVHNLKPHERHHRLGEMLFPLWFPRLVTHVISLTLHGLESAREMYPALRGKVSAVIPHGHYRGAYPSAPTRASCRDQLGLAHCFTFLFFGNIRRYKNVPLLIEAFRALPQRNVQLLIAGQPRLEAEADELRALVASDERIRLALEFVPEERVPLYMGAADVVVLPFDSILNSGSVFLALSFNRTVLAPRLGSLPEIQSRVGARWVKLYDGQLSVDHLSAALASRIEEGETANLHEFDWDAIGQQTLDFYVASAPAQDRPLPAKRVVSLPDTR
jgi:beta-1,4-mannosyltransferase